MYRYLELLRYIIKQDTLIYINVHNFSYFGVWMSTIEKILILNPKQSKSIREIILFKI